jgi:NADPH:quinone reductase-like Zn-dependent oxidoreductase
MKAIVLKQHGTLDEVAYAECPNPHVGPDDVLVEIKAAALNRLDLWVLHGWRGLRLDFPHIMGCDGSGVIVEIGDNVMGYEIGDRVGINPTWSCGQCNYCLSGRDNMCDQFAIFGEHIPGFYAEYQAVPARNLIKLPDKITHEVAAAASLVYVTAWHSLIEIGRLKPGEDILIVGAGGGVNTACIDIARLAGASNIYVVGSSEKKLGQARHLGANFTFNRQETDWGKAIFEATDRQGVDVVVDNVGAATFMESLRSLKKGGRLLTVGNTSGARFEIDNRYIFGKHLSILGSTMGTIQDYRTVMNFVFTGALKPLIDTVFPLSEASAALERLEAAEVSGKLVLTP